MALYCTQNMYYLPSRPQRRGISHAESKTECQPTNHCKLYSSEIPDGARDRKALDYARKHSRYGHRDLTMVLVTYRHGLRASEVCDLQWHQIELDHGRMHVRRAKNGTPSVHPIRGDEIRALRKLRRESPTEA
jgi:integrase